MHKQVDNAKKELDKKLREHAGFGANSRENIDTYIFEIFESDYYDALLNLEQELDKTDTEPLTNTNFKIVFDTEVLKFLQDQNTTEMVDQYSQKYRELTDSSTILRNNFQYHHATQVLKQLGNNNFFEAGHSLNLVAKDTKEKTEYSSKNEILEVIESEKKRILNDPSLRTKFDAFHGKLTNKKLQDFRDYITENQHIIPHLQDMVAFKRKLWVQYLRSAKNEYVNLIECYKDSQAELKKIINQASSDRNDWDKVLNEFNRRFLHLPFKAIVENKTDVILKDSAPSIGFEFKDNESQRLFGEGEKKDFLRILSTGEARALYILNVMFGIHIRWKNRKATLLVFDDIADSFDYKNKFAIVDYLQYIVCPEDSNFLAIILTHNFDFLRTIESRGICPAHQCRLAYKSNGKIYLEPFKQSDIRSPLRKWKTRIHEPVIQVAFMPFLRNLIEYMQGSKTDDGKDNNQYLRLTNMLHFTDQTESLTLNDYRGIFIGYFSDCDFPKENLDTKIIDYIFEAAAKCLEQDDGINFEYKIVLSIALRIWSEKYVVTKIRENDSSYEPLSKQTGELVNDFIELFNNQSKEIRILKRVALITPANIHINAFMYEPILDMGFDELKDLYKEVQSELK